MEIYDTLERQVMNSISSFSKGDYYNRPEYWIQMYWCEVHGIDGVYNGNN